MDSWSAPVLPSLPRIGPIEFRLFDTARQSVHTVQGGTSRTMYVCGITPYDATHMGHAATMISFDLIRRLWHYQGLDTCYVQNVTDIDDPLLGRARQTGEDWRQLAVRETVQYRLDMEALRIVPPDHYIGAVEYIPEIVGYVEKLLGLGAAYRVADATGDIYFDLRSAPRFGYQSHLGRAAMLSTARERGGDVDRAGKRDRLDPLLWRSAREGEPSWDGRAIGPGRPGWHIECAAITLGLLGTPIDVQGGGSDLIFPHHECCAAHAEVLTDTFPFARHYVHAGMIGLNGEKMSKTKGNLAFVGEYRRNGIDPMMIRLALLAGHYRADRDWTAQRTEEAVARLVRWRSALRLPGGPSGTELLGRIVGALADDLDTPRALYEVDRWADAARTGDDSDSDAPALAALAIDGLLGIQL